MPQAQIADCTCPQIGMCPLPQPNRSMQGEPIVLSARFEEPLDPLVGQPEQLGGVAPAEAEPRELPDRFDRLTLRLGACQVGIALPLEPLWVHRAG